MIYFKFLPYQIMRIISNDLKCKLRFYSARWKVNKRLATYESNVNAFPNHRREMTFKPILDWPWFAFWDYWFASNHDQCGWGIQLPRKLHNPRSKAISGLTAAVRRGKVEMGKSIFYLLHAQITLTRGRKGARAWYANANNTRSQIILPTGRYIKRHIAEY